MYFTRPITFTVAISLILSITFVQSIPIQQSEFESNNIQQPLKMDTTIAHVTTNTVDNGLSELIPQQTRASQRTKAKRQFSLPTTQQFQQQQFQQQQLQQQQQFQQQQLRNQQQFQQSQQLRPQVQRNGFNNPTPSFGTSTLTGTPRIF
ncbi:hypothetical protein DFH28DRAFT_1222678 [Melampsora americana]|nr:hypothetical protein DFH28DRAFT_1222678 [Melampsora americana]